MDFINKHKFLAELGRLLTFMYEEDRQYALAMYGRLFDDAVDEHGLLQLLVSPTRQAVVLARSYDAKERKLQVQSQSRDELYSIDEDELPAFVMVIDDIAIQAEDMGFLRPLVDEDQMSIFDEDLSIFPVEEPASPAAEAEDLRSLEEDLPAAAQAEEISLPSLQAEEESAEIVSDLETVLAEENTAEAEVEPENEAVEERSSVDETADAVDAFLASFSIENGELIAKAAPEEAEAPLPETAEETEAAPETAESAEEAQQEAEAEPLPAEAAQESPAEAAPAMQTTKKLNVLLLIVYLFFAIPLGFIGVDILLFPALLFLSLAMALVGFGAPIIVSCFGSFAVIADTLMVFGIGLVLVALALLFAWTFIWFIGGAIVGFIRALISLGKKFCIKEVPLK